MSITIIEKAPKFGVDVAVLTCQQSLSWNKGHFA